MNVGDGKQAHTTYYQMINCKHYVEINGNCSTFRVAINSNLMFSSGDVKVIHEDSSKKRRPKTINMLSMSDLKSLIFSELLPGVDIC